MTSEYERVRTLITQHNFHTHFDFEMALLPYAHEFMRRHAIWTMKYNLEFMWGDIPHVIYPSEERQAQAHSIIHPLYERYNLDIHGAKTLEQALKWAQLVDDGKLTNENNPYTCAVYLYTHDVELGYNWGAPHGLLTLNYIAAQIPARRPLSWYLDKPSYLDD